MYLQTHIAEQFDISISAFRMPRLVDTPPWQFLLNLSIP